MRLSRFIIAALIFAIGIFPLSGVTLVAGGAGHHGHAEVAAHDHDAAAADHAHDEASHAASHDENSSACCDSMACHGFGLSAAPCLSTPVAYIVKLACFHDQQGAGTLSIRIERPPRTV